MRETSGKGVQFWIRICKGLKFHHMLAEHSRLERISSEGLFRLVKKYIQLSDSNAVIIYPKYMNLRHSIFSKSRSPKQRKLLHHFRHTCYWFENLTGVKSLAIFPTQTQIQEDKQAFLTSPPKPSTRLIPDHHQTGQ